MYSTVFGWNGLYISIKYLWSNVPFKANVSLSIFCLDHQFIDVSGVLKSPTLIVLMSVYPFMSVNVCFIYLGASILGTYVLTIMLSSWIGFFSKIEDFFLTHCSFSISDSVSFFFLLSFPYSLFLSLHLPPEAKGRIESKAISNLYWSKK